MHVCVQNEHALIPNRPREFLWLFVFVIIMSRRLLPDTIIQHQIIIQMLLSLLLLCHIILSQCLCPVISSPPSIPLSLCIPLLFSPSPVLVSASLSVSLPEPVWSLPVGVCVWVRTPCNLQVFVLKMSFYIFQEASRQPTPVCVCVYPFLFLFSVDESRQQCRHNRITLQKITAARDHISIYRETFLHEAQHRPG